MSFIASDALFVTDEVWFVPSEASFAVIEVSVAEKRASYVMLETLFSPSKTWLATG